MVMGAVSSAAMAATLVMAARVGRVVLEGQTASGDLQEAVATSTTRVVLDDIGMPPGYALKVHNRTGTLKIEERYGPYKARALHNPCMRSPPEGRKGAHPKGFRMCPFWGFAVSRYLRPGVPRAVGVAPSS